MEKEKKIDWILRNKTYVEDSELMVSLRHDLNKLSLIALRNLQLIIRLREVEFSQLPVTNEEGMIDVD